MRLSFRAAILFGCSLLASASFAGEPVALEVFERMPEKWDWTPPNTPAEEKFSVPALSVVRLPARYNARGIEIDRVGPLVLHATATVRLPLGKHRFVMRSRNAARLLVDAHVLAETKLISRNSAGHEDVPPENVPEDPRWHPLPPSGQERVLDWVSDGDEHRVELWAVVGGKGLRNETGELSVAIAATGQVPTLIGSDVPLTDEGWGSFVQSESLRLDALDTARRRHAAASDEPYWTRRHELARRVAESLPPRLETKPGNLIDRHLGETLAPLSDDASFFRRLTLDTLGVIPDAEEVQKFLNDESPDKRRRVIDERLADPRWADGWMGYWQDVLAENPGLLKPTLNNTGPFRQFVHNAIADNLPMDRFVTELVRMEGSVLGGGPAGFGLATQNDSPMAAKAHVLAKAFLAAEMKCARCHDAPFHPFAQEDLFGLASMLAGKPLTIPATSTVKQQPGGREPSVSISLSAGDSVAPGWGLAEIAPEKLPAEILPKGATPREQLAALITAPQNQRFAPVLVNRLWQRYLGEGLVEPVDDWDGSIQQRHPALLADLARELVTHDYDLKHVVRLILNSRAYQGQPRGGKDKLVGAPAPRRMSAEQVLDSLFAAVGKPFRAEELCLDIDGRRPPNEFLNLGVPRRAWQLTLPSNERDRPALTLPVASSLTDVLIAFGWRVARPDPITLREDTTTPLRPAQMANGVVIGTRIARLSDDSAITDLCLRDQHVEALVKAVVLRILSRPATPAEVKRLAAYLGVAYANRIVVGAMKQPPMKASARRVSWSNHLHPDASRIQAEEERVVREGDPATRRLTPVFRERMEDVVWALVNSPEFVFIP